MSVSKNTLKHAVRLAIEAGGYGAGGAIAATDAFHVHEEPEPDLPYQFDGSRDGKAAGTGGGQVRDARAGRGYVASLVHRVRPAGAAYSAAVKPSVHNLLRAHGMSATLDATPGAELWSYRSFTDGTWESLFGDITRGKELLPFVGAYVSKWTHVARGLGVPIWTFDVNGISSALPTDQAALPAVTYPNASVAHPRAAGSTLTLQANGGVAFQGKVREATVTSTREITERSSQSEAGGTHPGHQLGTFSQLLELVVEATNLAASPYTAAATLDPYRATDAGTMIRPTYTVNPGTQYQRYRFNADNYSAQITECRPDKDGAIRLWQLTLALTPSSEVADDGLQVVFN